MKICIDRESVHKQTEEPVEGEEGGVHAVCVEMFRQHRQLLRHQLLEDGLVNLGANQLLGVVGGRHHDVDNVDHQPEGVLLIQEQQSDGRDSVETLRFQEFYLLKLTR